MSLLGIPLFPRKRSDNLQRHFNLASNLQRIQDVIGLLVVGTDKAWQRRQGMPSGALRTTHKYLAISKLWGREVRRTLDTI